MELQKTANQVARELQSETVDTAFVESKEPADFTAINVEGCLSSHRAFD